MRQPEKVSRVSVIDWNRVRDQRNAHEVLYKQRPHG